MKMGPKRDKMGFKSKEDRSEQTQADHELFLQAFESKTCHSSYHTNSKSSILFRANTDL